MLTIPAPADARKNLVSSLVREARRHARFARQAERVGAVGLEKATRGLVRDLMAKARAWRDEA